MTPQTVARPTLAPSAPSSAAAELVAREVAAWPRDVRSVDVAPHVTPAPIREHLSARFSFAAPMPLVEALDDVATMLRAWTLHVTHPRHFGLFNPGVHEAGVWADALAALYNPQVGAWGHAPAAVEIERHVLRFLAGALGLPAEPLAAHFTTGGSEANHTAVLCALAHAFPEFPTDGLARLAAEPIVYASAAAHHSFLKIARATGLGERALVRVGCDGQGRMAVGQLRACLAADRDAGRRPVLVVATAGATADGAIDDLPAVAEAAAGAGAWFHVDAAWGGMAALSPTLRPHLDGIARADSVTWDAHKGLSVPMGAGMFFTRHREALSALFAVQTPYVPAEAVAGEDLYRASLQWSRRFIGLKVFLTLATLGREGVAAMIEHQCAMAALLRQRVVERGWRVVNDTPLPLVCFAHPTLLGDDARTRALVERVQAGGRVWVSEVALPVDGRTSSVLRACVTSHRTGPADVEALVEELDVVCSSA